MLEFFWDFAIGRLNLEVCNDSFDRLTNRMFKWIRKVPETACV